MGGLISDKVVSSVNKVPVLGDIPILGWLFKNKSKQRTKTSLVMFITPHIIRYPEDLERISIQKNEERKRFMMQNRLKDSPNLKYKKLEETIRIKNKEKNSMPLTPVNGPSGSFLNDITPNKESDQSL